MCRNKKLTQEKKRRTLGSFCKRSEGSFRKIYCIYIMPKKISSIWILHNWLITSIDFLISLSVRIFSFFSFEYTKHCQSAPISFWSLNMRISYFRVKKYRLKNENIFFLYTKRARNACDAQTLSGRSRETRTPGLSIPNAARYQLRYTPDFISCYRLFQQYCVIISFFS